MRSRCGGWAGGPSNTFSVVGEKSMSSSRSLQTGVYGSRRLIKRYSYLTVYSLIVFAAIVFQVSATVTWTYGSVRASRSLHRVLLDSLLRSTFRSVLNGIAVDDTELMFRWLDVTPTSRVVARCTQDIQAGDRHISSRISESAPDIS